MKLKMRRVCAAAFMGLVFGTTSASVQSKPLKDAKALAPASDWQIAFSLATGARPEKMVFSPDGKALYVLLTDEVQKWDVATRRKVWTHKEASPISDFALSFDGSVVALAASTRVTLCSGATGKLRATLLVKAYAVAFSRDGRWLATAGDNGHLTSGLPTRVALTLWKNGDWQRVRTTLIPLRDGFEALKESFQVTALDFSPDSERLVVTTTVGFLFECDLKGNLIADIEGRPSSFIRFAPDGRTAIGRWVNVVTSESSDYSLALYDPKTWTMLDNNPHYPGNDHISSAGEFICANSIAYTPDSRTIAAAFGDGFLGLFDVRSGQLKTTIARAGKKYWSTPLAFSPDGRQLASGFWKQVDFWQKK